MLKQKCRHIPQHRAKGTPLNTHTHTPRHTISKHTHTHSEQRAESSCQVAGGGSQLRTSTEEEERHLAGLESEMHKRQRQCPGLDAARGALEGFPEHASREDRSIAGMVFGQLLGCGQPLFVTEKSDPRHSCPVLSWTFLFTGPELQWEQGCCSGLKPGLHTLYCLLLPHKVLNKMCHFSLSCVCSIAGLGQMVC